MNDSETEGIDEQAPWRFRLRVKHLFYAMAVIGVSIATFGIGGIILGLLFLCGWSYVYANLSSSPQASGILLICALITVVIPVVQNHRPVSRSTWCRSNISQLSIALENFRNVNGRYPPPFIADANGRPMHSWRVLLMPYLEGGDFYRAYDFKQPWDSPHNLKLAKEYRGRQHGEVYQCPCHEQSDRSGIHTSYFAVVGPNTMWASDAPPIAPDGDDMTILLMEDHSREVLWTEPVDLSYQEAIALVSATDRLGPHVTLEGGYRQIALADWEVTRLPQGTHAEYIAALLNRDDGIDNANPLWDAPNVNPIDVDLRNQVLRSGRAAYWWTMATFLARRIMFLAAVLWPIGWLGSIGKRHIVADRSAISA